MLGPLGNHAAPLNVLLERVCSKQVEVLVRGTKEGETDNERGEGWGGEE